jgi:hypothetical protein
MVLNDKVGIASINQALSDLGHEATFSDIFADWLVANYINDCELGNNREYCYTNEDLDYQRLHVDPMASYAGFADLTISRTGTTKDWTGQWYRFRQNDNKDERDTFKLEFEGNGSRADFKVPYIVQSPSQDPEVGFIDLEDQEGVVYVPDFVSQNKTVIIAPFNRFKKSGFGENEPNISFTFNASTVERSEPIISGVSPSEGNEEGGFEIILNGSNFEGADNVFFGGEEIEDFEVVDDNTITFTAPAGSEGMVDVRIDVDGNEYTLNDAFEYNSENNETPEYPEGSLLRAKDGYKVYVINEHGYKRWIQTAEIFNYYGHLKWGDIIEVERNVLDEYETSWLIRAAEDEKVYQLDSNGIRHWLNMSAQEFIDGGRSWDAIFVINNWERDYYDLGEEILE